MFSIWCDGCAAEVLIWPSLVEGIEGDGRSDLCVRFHCLAGHAGSWRPERLIDH
ncbi:MAG: hypothetical protein S0880_04135 [Actinomycetota bacterium]|nr:hypothetical protein [Actinomycetota bacterium]